MTNVITIHDKKFVELISKRTKFDKETFYTLVKIGVIDLSRIKTILIRELVFEKVKNGNGKIDSMYATAEECGVSYEYVRNAIYYYKHVTLDNI